LSPERYGVRGTDGSSSSSTYGQEMYGQGYEGYMSNQSERSDDDTPTFMLDVPVLNIDELNLEVNELRAHVSSRAELANFVKINVGVDIYIDDLKLDIKGLEAQALLRVQLDRVLGTLDRALEAINNNPQILSEVVQDVDSAVDDTGGDASQRARESEQNVGSVPQLEDVAGHGGAETQDTGSSSDQLTDDTADEPGWTVDRSGDAVETSSSKPGEVDSEEKTGSLADLQIEEEYVDEQGRIVGRARDESGNVVEEVLDEEGEVLAQDVPEEAEGRGTEEDIEVDATEGARRKADELDVELSDIKGTGSGGRVLVRDVEKASRRAESSA
jgi:hypothetical protein